MIGINGDNDIESLQEVIEKEKINWRSFADVAPEGEAFGPLAELYKISGWPTIHIVDAQGVIRYKNVRGAALQKGIELLLKEMGHEVNLSAAGPDRKVESRSD